MSLPDIMTPDGRRAWSFIAIVGGTITFTIFAAVGVYLVRNSAGLAFWLALAAHAQVFLGMSALGWALGRRMSIEVSREGVKSDDRTAEAAHAVADAATDKADEFNG